MAALNKRLTMDILRQKRQAGALCSNDAKSCYDRIVHWVATLSLMRAGARFEPCYSMFCTLAKATHTVTTAFGLTRQSYASGKIPLQGVGQGNGSGPTVWACISAVLTSMMYALGHRVNFLAPLSLSLTVFVCYAFVDDTDVIHVGHSEEVPGEQVAKEMQEVVNCWEWGLRASGGTLVPSKSHWYLIDFVWRNKKWQYRTEKEEMPGSLWVADTCGSKKIKLTRHAVEHAEKT